MFVVVFVIVFVNVCLRLCALSWCFVDCVLCVVCGCALFFLWLCCLVVCCVLRSGIHCDLALAVEVRQCPLRSGGGG